MFGFRASQGSHNNSGLHFIRGSHYTHVSMGLHLKEGLIDLAALYRVSISLWLPHQGGGFHTQPGSRMMEWGFNQIGASPFAYTLRILTKGFNQPGALSQSSQGLQFFSGFYTCKLHISQDA